MPGGVSPGFFVLEARLHEDRNQSRGQPATWRDGPDDPGNREPDLTQRIRPVFDNGRHFDKLEQSTVNWRDRDERFND